MVKLFLSAFILGLWVGCIVLMFRELWEGVVALSVFGLFTLHLHQDTYPRIMYAFNVKEKQQ